jgi:hypothetical protein
MSKAFWKCGLLIAAAVLLTLPDVVHAATITSLIGDIDNFNNESGELAPFDGNEISIPYTFVHTYTLPAGEVITGGSWQIAMRGIGDCCGADSWVANGTVLLTLADFSVANNGGTHIRTLGLFANHFTGTGTEMLELRASAGDSWTVDYSRLVIQTAPAAVPEPGSMLLVGSGVLLLARRMRRRTRP